jgi:hypothetical protein
MVWERKDRHKSLKSHVGSMSTTIILLQVADAIASNSNGAVGAVQNAISGNISWLLVGIAFFVIAAMLFFYLKNLVVNTILGILGWGILTYVFHLQLPFWASLIVSAVFGLAGLGAIVVLAFLGIVQ